MLALFLSAPLALCQTATMSARDYYNELHKTGGLDIAGDYVCFYKDESNPNFFIFILSQRHPRTHEGRRKFVQIDESAA
jgi:hypothetical protein